MKLSGHILSRRIEKWVMTAGKRSLVYTRCTWTKKTVRNIRGYCCCIIIICTYTVIYLLNFGPIKRNTRPEEEILSGPAHNARSRTYIRAPNPRVTSAFFSSFFFFCPRSPLFRRRRRSLQKATPGASRNYTHTLYPISITTTIIIIITIH